MPVYSSRTHTYSPGDQVTSSDLNAIQDGIVDCSDAIDALDTGKLSAGTATANMTDSPAPDAGGAVMAFGRKSTNGTNVVVLDAQDWRHRMMHIVGYLTEDAAYIPGGANDEGIYETLDSSNANHLNDICYGENGQTGAFNSPGIYRTPTGWTENVRVFIRNTDGYLCTRKSAHAADPDIYIVFQVIGSPCTNQS